MRLMHHILLTRQELEAKYEGHYESKITKKTEVEFAAQRKAARDQQNKDFKDMITRQRRDMADEQEIEISLLD